MKPLPLVVICGPTASGKTDLALHLAERWPLEIISADSRQVYRGMDIGTAKATEGERLQAPHHLVDVVDPDQDFSTADFSRLAREAAADIQGRGKRAVVVGGTGLYIRNLTGGLVDAPPADAELRRSLLAWELREGEGALLRRLQTVDPPLAARLNPRDQARIVRALEVFQLSGRRLSELQQEHAFGDRAFRVLLLGLNVDRGELYRRIDQRVERMLAAGLLEETRGLLAAGFHPQLKALRTIGYRELIQFVQGELSLAEATALIQRNSRRYAKRQLTWFGKEPEIIWVDSLRESDKITSLIDEFYAD